MLIIVVNHVLSIENMFLSKPALPLLYPVWPLDYLATGRCYHWNDRHPEMFPAKLTNIATSTYLNSETMMYDHNSDKYYTIYTDTSHFPIVLWQ